MNIYCAKNKFTELYLIGPHNKLNGVNGLGKHYQMCFDTKLGHEMRAICRIPCTCSPCKYMLNQPWTPGMPEQQQPHCQPVRDSTYWHVLGSFENCSNIQLLHEAPSSEEIDKIIQAKMFQD